MRGRIIPLVVSVIAAVAVVGLTAVAVPRWLRGPTPYDTGDVQPTLDRMARAFWHHDEAGFLAPFDRRRPALVARERRVFQNLVQLPVRQFDLRARGFYSAHGGPDTAVVDWIVRFRGVDRGPSQSTHRTTVRWVHGRLRITDDRLAFPGRGNYQVQPAPWDVTSLTVVRKPRVTVAVSPDAAGRARDLAQVAEQAAAADQPYLDPGWARHYLVFATGDQRLWTTWFSGVSAKNSAEALGVAVPASELDPAPTLRRVPAVGARVVLDLARLTDGAALGETLRHEFVHAASTAITVGQSARWVVEGYAVWVSEVPKPGWLPAEACRALRDGSEIPDVGNAEFYRQGALDYGYAFLLFDYLQRTYGPARTRKFFDAAVRAPEAAVDPVLARVFGISSAELHLGATRFAVAACRG